MPTFSPRPRQNAFEHCADPEPLPVRSCNVDFRGSRSAGFPSAAQNARMAVERILRAGVAQRVEEILCFFESGKVVHFKRRILNPTARRFNAKIAKRRFSPPPRRVLRTLFHHDFVVAARSFVLRRAIRNSPRRAFLSSRRFPPSEILSEHHRFRLSGAELFPEISFKSPRFGEHAVFENP